MNDTSDYMDADKCHQAATGHGAEERTMTGQGCYLSPAWKGSSAFNARRITGQAAVNWGSNESSCRLFNQIPIAHHGKSSKLNQWSPTQKLRSRLCSYENTKAPRVKGYEARVLVWRYPVRIMQPWAGIDTLNAYIHPRLGLRRLRHENSASPFV